MKSFHTPQAILFDWDETLVDNWQTIFDSLNETLRRFDLDPWPEDEARLRIHHSLRDSFPKLFQERWKEARSIYYQEFEQRHLEHLRAFESAEQILVDLAEAGIFVGVVSNKYGPYLRREVAALGWESYFGSVVGAGDAVADKPDPAPIALALSDAPEIYPAESIWFIGDSPLDLQAAHRFGCVPVLLKRHELPLELFISYPARIEINNLLDLGLVMAQA